MKRQGLQGVRRGKFVRTMIADAAAPCPLDRVNRQFKADRPNQLWVSDFTYVSTWQGWLYVAFVIDVFARRIVGWRVSSSMHVSAAVILTHWGCGGNPGLVYVHAASPRLSRYSRGLSESSEILIRFSLYQRM